MYQGIELGKNIGEFIVLIILHVDHTIFKLKECGSMLLKYAVKDFLTEKKFKNLSKYTLDNYTRDLRMFSDYCLDQSVKKVD